MDIFSQSFYHLSSIDKTYHDRIEYKDSVNAWSKQVSILIFLDFYFSVYP